MRNRYLYFSGPQTVTSLIWRLTTGKAASSSESALPSWGLQPLPIYPLGRTAILPGKYPSYPRGFTPKRWLVDCATMSSSFRRKRSATSLPKLRSINLLSNPPAATFIARAFTRLARDPCGVLARSDGELPSWGVVQSLPEVTQLACCSAAHASLALVRFLMWACHFTELGGPLPGVSADRRMIATRLRS